MAKRQATGSTHLSVQQEGRVYYATSSQKSFKDAHQKTLATVSRSVEQTTEKGSATDSMLFRPGAEMVEFLRLGMRRDFCAIGV